MTVKPSLLQHNTASSNVEATYSEPQNTSGTQGNPSPVKALRPKSVNTWTVADVQKWFRRNCGDYYHLYSIKFLEQDITGALYEVRFFYLLPQPELLELRA